ncbi:baicalein 7-O-glucuronosyltransferase-like [Andrographis paniculata]|uniref:Glycosyltransferase n=1 Tax=Andrographis paniculata TaxID=175694 RepID=A0A3Q8GXN7_ANDPA|nr:baicalein 7-O-glucuronosyltransferase-like [Andrographis paniculata]AXL95250.1 UDP-glycosyltransferase [Andrographis paniculata]
MEDDSTIVLYSSPEHINTMFILAKFITKHQPTVKVTVLCSAPAPAEVEDMASVTYHRIPAAVPSVPIDDPVELLFEIPRLNKADVRDALQEISRKLKIVAFVIDFFCYSAFEVSTSLNVPTYFYVSNGGFGASSLLFFPVIDEIVAGNIADLDEFLEFPGGPPMHTSELPKLMAFRQSNNYQHFLRTAMEARKSKGIIVNSFDALEYRAKEALSNGLCVPNGVTPPAYYIGPLIGETAGKSNGGVHECVKWLDSQPNRSVIFLCFGRRGLFSAKQVKEIAVGLENSGHHFLWSVRRPPEMQSSSPAGEFELDEILPDGFLERTKKRGLVIKSWAPQKEVLSHNSVGAFVTHCGRSSILEAVSFGVPMIGWPIYAEQHMNCASLVEDLNLAVKMVPADGVVTAEELENRIRELMETATGKSIRHRVSEMKVSAAAAARRNGTSVAALEKFIRSLREG